MSRSLAFTGTDAVAAEVRAELAHHLACLEEELLAGGRTPDEARREARARFGDPDRIERACWRIRMGRTMTLHRLHLAATAALLLVVVALGLRHVQARNEARAVADAWRAEAERMAALASEARSRAEGPAPEPVGEIVIGVGSVLEVIDNAGHVHFTDRVAADGKILVPSADWVDVAGLTRAEAERRLTEFCSQYYEGVDIKVKVDPLPPR